ncbi:MAG: (Fe-S)-binding protein [Tetrasphaera sp.]
MLANSGTKLHNCIHVPHRSARHTRISAIKLDQCIHCGLCLSACPTYAVNQLEMDSPRGRIALMRGAADGRIGLEGAFQAHIDLCLGCRACETACPSGVQYGAAARNRQGCAGRGTTNCSTQRRGDAEIRRDNGANRPSPLAPRISSALQRFGLRALMPSRDRLRWLARGLWLYQRLGLSAVADARCQAARRPDARWKGMAPPIRLDYPDYSRPASAYRQRRGKVAFFTGCVQDAFLANVNRATIRVLQHNGYEVHFPSGQTCCDAAALHSGDLAFTRDLARQQRRCICR